MANEWTLNLEKTGGRDGLKDPLGYKQEIADVVVRSAQKANVTQNEVYEKVSLPKLSGNFIHQNRLNLVNKR